MPIELLPNLPEGLEDQTPRVIANHIAGGIQTAAGQPASRTIGTAKDISEFYTLVKQAITHSENADNVSAERKVDFSRDYTLDPDGMKNEIITYKLERRQPGDFSQGDPFGGSVKNLKPIFRESVDDKDNPTYKKLIFGYWYDNEVEFICYGRTNKEADERALWFEKLMNNYSWFFRYSGINRVLYLGRGEETSEKFDGYTMSGRSIRYFVKTEEISVVSEKAIEQIVLNLSITQ